MVDGVVETAQGKVRGRLAGRSWMWRALPYAAPPLGPLRFREPLPPESWAGCRDATAFGVTSLQKTPLIGRAPSSEDCLTLNVWSPAADGRKRPVMVWVHGGAFVSGSGAFYEGGALAGSGDIVVVTLNYRLGVLGFVNFGDVLDDPGFGSNLGLHDVVAALGWVRDNIAAFGGDPGRVTLAGLSAGSIIVSLLMLSAAVRPLFHAAILQSGAWNLVHSRERSRLVAATHLDILGIGANEGHRLREVPAARLLEAGRLAGRKLDGMSPAAPWFDGALLPATFADATRVDVPPMPVLAGSTRDEMIVFNRIPGPKILPAARDSILGLIDRDLNAATAARLRHAYPDARESNRALATDVNFAMPTLHMAERNAASGGASWVYRFDYAHPLFGAMHALDLLFLWPFPGPLAALARGGWLTGLRSGLSERMRAAWTSFVRTGSPGDDWPRYTVEERQTRLLALQDRVVSDPMRERRDAWGGRDVGVGI